LPEHVSFPVYPASKDLAAFGGMVMNNCAGERTLRYGQMRDFIEQLHMVLADGNLYEFKKLTMPELDQKIAQNNFEGEVYKKIFNLVSDNYDVIKNAKPKVSKNSSGYALWRVWDREKGIFDLSQLFVGSQGTLGIMTDATVRLVKEQPCSKLIALFFNSWDQLPDVVNSLLPYDPESLEAFDDATMRLGIRFMPEIAKKAHMSLFKFAMSFLPEVGIGIRMLGMPKLIVLVELREETQAEIDKKRAGILQTMKKFPKVIVRPLDKKVDDDKYWIIRRESFALLRKHVGDKRTAPFIDDFCILPKDMPSFLPKLLKILKDNGVKANIAGHAGDGNYHIIPLMDMRKASERAKIAKVLKLVVDLIVSYGGTITAEHNDGIIRTPFVEEMFGPEVYKLFEQVKDIFDPKGIFNPGKKVRGSIEYMEKHIAKS
jgi:FAD/FMN-containing dehydrogenase